MKKTLSVIIVCLVIISVGVLLWLRFGINEEHIRHILSDALGPGYEIELESASVYPGSRSIALSSLLIRHTESGRTAFEADTLSISGLSLRTFSGNRLLASTFKIDSFILDWPDEASGSSDFQFLSIKTIEATNGTIIRREEGQETDRLNDFNLLSTVQYDPPTDADTVAIRDHRIAINSLDFKFFRDRYQVELRELEYIEQDSTLTVSSLDLTPIGGFARFMNSLEYETNMFKIAASNISANQIDPVALRSEDLVSFDHLELDTFNIHVSQSLKLPENPDEEDPELLNVIVQNLPYALQIGSILINSSDIQFSQLAEEGVRPGTISFMNSSVHMDNINSESEKAVTFKTTTYLENHAELETELNFTIDDGTFHMSGSGDLAPFELKELNSIFMDLEGIEIMSGVAHELEFEFEMVDDHSTGTMHLVYEDLSIQSIDKYDHEKRYQYRFIGYLFDDLPLRSENLAENRADLRTGTIDHERASEDPFFRYLWHTLRSGIYDIALRVDISE